MPLRESESHARELHFVIGESSYISDEIGVEVVDCYQLECEQPRAVWLRILQCVQLRLNTSKVIFHEIVQCFW